MMFLAVFLGFVAENTRENLHSIKKEKEYAAFLVKDIQTDTESIHKVIKKNISLKKNYDSLLILLKNSSLLNNADLVYYYFIPPTCCNPFSSTQRTIQQLENSGGMRFFDDMPLSDSILLISI